jgi:hypothetical protein
LLYCRWATGKGAAAISAVFILPNSIAALTGHFSATHNLPPGLPLFALSALAGGAIGSNVGSVHLSNLAIYRILGANPAARRTEALFYLNGLERNSIGLHDTFGPRQNSVQQIPRQFAN